jgi:hypothetical protein
MGSRITTVGVAAVALAGIVGVASSGEEAVPPAFTETFLEKDADLVSRGTNPWFVLEPGRRMVYEGVEDGEKVRLVVTVLDETRKVGEVETRVVEERESKNGELEEVSRNYFAISKRTNSVYYFGEDVDVYEGGKVKGHPGAWLSGKDGARYGLMMAGTPCVGARYVQEIAPNVAMDRAEVKSLTDSIDTPAGTYTDCLTAEETSPLEPKSRSSKVYAPGVGMVRDDALRLVEISPTEK